MRKPKPVPPGIAAGTYYLVKHITPYGRERIDTLHGRVARGELGADGFLIVVTAIVVATARRFLGLGLLLGVLVGLFGAWLVLTLTRWLG